MMIYYRRFGIITEAVEGGFVYSITGGGLRCSIETDAPLETERKAVDKAKEFIDEHLVKSEPTP